VRVGRRDASYAFKVLSEFVRFFRRPEHWRTLEDVKRFIGDKREGRYREFRGDIPGMTNTVTSEKAPEGMPMPTCSVPPGKETLVDSRIYWSRGTCAHVVMGQILKLYLELGGPNGKLGYPIDDETYSPDHYGRISLFEHGEILWYPDKGPHVTYKEHRNPKDDDDRKEKEPEKQKHQHQQ